MKKFLTIVAGVVVLGAGVYAEPAKAQHTYQGSSAGNRTTNTNIINGHGNTINQTTVNHIKQTSMKGFYSGVCRVWESKRDGLCAEWAVPVRPGWH